MRPHSRHLALLLLFAACTDPAAPPGPPAVAPFAEVSPPARYASVLLEGAPHVRQKPDFCGEACVEMATARLGRRVSQDEVFALTDLDPALGRGAYTKELAEAVAKLGFAVGPVWQPIEAARAAQGMEASFAALHADLLQGIPSIVCMHYDDRPRTTEHFRLVLGYDERTDEVIYSEPAEDAGGYRRMPRSRFLALWPLKYEPARWTVIRIRLDPAPMLAAGSPAAPPAQGRFTPAAYAQHVMTLREKLPKGFSLVVKPPFVVVGDQRPDVVRGHAENTVEWAVEKLKQDYFDKDPQEILDVWLFGGKKSYETYTKAIFNDKPTTPYGYYSSEHKALIMNINTGGGTLVHEIVHPFVEADFPDAPAWLNEGMGSLFEACAERDGHIVGVPNWRLPGLQEAIKRHAVPSFSEFTSTTTKQFYEEDPGTNYAQARYLCYYLQEQGLMVRYYKEFRAGHAADPTGYATLQKVLGERDMDAFKARWEAWVMRIAFR
ncbi:MAG: C39 family peptidase [Minicystis sp.]